MKRSESVQKPKRKTGRPLSFDREAALEQAMLTFWRHGYETTSIVDLTTAMKVTAPSLYAAFGDKKHLFLEAVRRYAGDDATARAIDAAPSAFEAACAMLTGAAITYTGDRTPKGCLLASATATGSAAAADVQGAVAEMRRKLRDRLAGRIELDIENGLIPKASQPAVLADFVMAVGQGMSALARDGSSRSSLLALVNVALQAWPRSASASSPPST